MGATQIIATLVGVIVSLVGGVVFLYFRGEKLHRRYNQESNTNLLNMTKAMVETKSAINNNTAVNSEVKALLHTLNNNVIEIKVNGRNKKG